MRINNLFKNEILSSLEDDKAIDIKIIDLKMKTFFADLLIIASGNSRRHITSMAEHIKEKLSKKKLKVNIEGLNKSEWILIDCDTVIVHIFLPESRNYYNLEKIWSFNIKNK